MWSEIISAKAECFYTKLIDRCTTFQFDPVTFSAEAKRFYLIKKLIDRSKTFQFWPRNYLGESRMLCYTKRPKARRL
jgi:hypothetical protein